MLVVKNNKQYLDYNELSVVDPIESHDPLVVAMDPSKTNFAMVVGTPDGRILDIIEFSGNNRGKGPAMDNTVYCHELKHYLGFYFSKAHFYLVATEAALTQKGEKANHITNMALTEIRAAILGFFYEVFNIKVVQVNNWSWKHDQLAEGYRSPFQKMSKAYIRSLDPTHPLLDYFAEDACDAYFIFQYVVKHMCQNFTMLCNAHESSLNDFTYYITDPDTLEPNKYKEMMYNDQFTILENIVFYRNRIEDSFFILVPVQNLNLEDIYNNCFDATEETLLKDEAAIVVC